MPFGSEDKEGSEIGAVLQGRLVNDAGATRSRLRDVDRGVPRLASTSRLVPTRTAARRNRAATTLL